MLSSKPTTPREQQEVLTPTLAVASRMHHRARSATRGELYTKPCQELPPGRSWVSAIHRVLSPCLVRGLTPPSGYSTPLLFAYGYRIGILEEAGGAPQADAHCQPNVSPFDSSEFEGIRQKLYYVTLMVGSNSLSSMSFQLHYLTCYCHSEMRLASALS